MRIKFLALRPQIEPELRRLKKIMENDLLDLPIRDNAQPLKSSWDAMCMYVDRLVSPEYGASLFERRRIQVPFVGPNYLMRSGALDGLLRLYRTLSETAVEHPELA
jgi:hypothetical protein